MISTVSSETEFFRDSPSSDHVEEVKGALCPYNMVAVGKILTYIGHAATAVAATDLLRGK